MSVVREVGGAVLRRAGRVAGRLQAATDAPVDLLESDEEYLIVADAPGATASDVGVRYRDGSVEIRVDRFRKHREGFEMLFPGRPLAVDTAVDLEGVDPVGATATLRDDGTLHVRLPKVQETDDDPAAEGSADDGDGPATG